MTTDEQAGLVVDADLTVGLSNATLDVSTDDGILYVDARSFGALDELRTAAETEAVDVIRTLIVESPLELETAVVVRVRGSRVATYRPGERASRLAELLGIAPFSVDLRGVVRAAGRRLRPPRSV